MCRLAETAAEVIAAGGKLQFLCSSQHSYCRHHPKVAGSQCCGYKRQQAGQVRVWIIPANMLASPPPPALRRALRRILGDFDLLVIDEAPWFGMLGGHDVEPEGVPIGWLAPDWWSGRSSRCSAEQEARFLDLLSKLHGFLSNCSRGVVPIDALRQAGIEKRHLDDARKVIWR
jgi:hypothetical protein